MASVMRAYRYAGHHHLLTCIKLYCLVTEAHVCEQLAHGGYLKVVSIKCVTVHKVATPVQELTWHKAI